MNPFTDFRDATNEQMYVRVPDDHVVVIADIRGSTKLIADGRYRDVNLLGAAVIAGIMNEIGREEFAFVFGGDGASVILTQPQFDRIQPILLGIQQLAKTNFQIDLRIGSVPMHLISKFGGRILMAKFQMSPINTMAMFLGGGLAIAEKWIKNGHQGQSFLITNKLEKQSQISSNSQAPSPKLPKFETSQTQAPSPGYQVLPTNAGMSPNSPSMQGLSCRWQPMPTQNGVILSLMIQSTQSDNIAHQLQSLLGQIEKIIGHQTYHPFAKGEKIKPQSFLKAAIRETRLYPWREKPYRFAYVIVSMSVIYLNRKFGLKLFQLDVQNYVNETVINSDFRKIDDCLRMVIDVTTEQASAIEDLLEAEYHSGRIFYGTHRSQSAIMTCLVEKPVDNKHIHFIDGNDGGYAMAAKQMKKQLYSK